MSLLDRRSAPCCMAKPWPRLPGARGAWRCALLALLVVSAVLPEQAWARKVHLARKYRRGEKMVYETQLNTRTQYQLDPPSLQTFLPPFPTTLTMRQQTTVTVQDIHPDGRVDLQDRFDRFDIQSTFPEAAPENLRQAAQQAQDEFRQEVAGHALTAHYDREGRLLGFEGADELLEPLDAPLRESLRQALRVFLEQLGGNTIYPGHPVEQGETWKRTLSAPASKEYPFQSEGESTLHYVGNTTYRGVKAAIVEFEFANTLTPAQDSLQETGPISQLQAEGVRTEIHIQGQGKGRLLLALDNGRILQNQSTVHQTLNARMSGTAPDGPSLPQPVRVLIQTETRMEVEGSGK